VDAHWDLRFNITNLFDKKYYQPIGTVDSGNAFGEPRNFMVTANYKF
jgi:outer membrane receptor for ferric coprogen and ferric-rhodotorulic acid